MTAPDKEQRVQEAVRRHVRNSAFAEAEKVIAFVLSDSGVQEARSQVESGGDPARLGVACPPPAVPGPLRPGRARRRRGPVHGIRPGKHGRWGRICVLDNGHEVSMEPPHWGRISEGQPIAWVGSAPGDW